MTTAEHATTPPAAQDRDPVTIDSGVPHASRIYDFLLGGTNHFTVDREMAEHAFDAYPGGLDAARLDARANRAFLGRTVRFLAEQAGMRQFLDIGPGIPDSGSTHQIAQAVARDSRVLYVDNDPIVLAHAHALLAGAPEGTVEFQVGDLRAPDAILERAARLLDLDRPVGLLLVGVLHVVPDADDPQGCVARLVDALAPGSHVVVSHMTSDVVAEDEIATMSRRLDERMRTSNPPAVRDRAGVAAFLDGLALVEPGIVPVDQWHPDDGGSPPDRAIPIVGAVGRRR